MPLVDFSETGLAGNTSAEEMTLKIRRTEYPRLPCAAVIKVYLLKEELHQFYSTSLFAEPAGVLLRCGKTVVRENFL